MCNSFNKALIDKSKKILKVNQELSIYFIQVNRVKCSMSVCLDVSLWLYIIQYTANLWNGDTTALGFGVSVLGLALHPREMSGCSHPFFIPRWSSLSSADDSLLDLYSFSEAIFTSHSSAAAICLRTYQLTAWG